MSKTPGVGTERIEAFSDGGVFAIAITLLILEIKVPHPSAQSGPFSLIAALLGLWPSYFAYVLSFVMIGIYWANHHYIFKLFDNAAVRRVGGSLYRRGPGFTDQPLVGIGDLHGFGAPVPSSSAAADLSNRPGGR